MKNIIILINILSTFLLAQSRVEVHGTSTLHDWNMVSDSAIVEMEEVANKIKSLNVSLLIETLKSGDGSLDNNAYEAIKKIGVEKNESIIFKIIEYKEDGSFDGLFSIGKNKKRVNIIPESIDNGVIKGSFKTKMSSFGIEPPEFLFGMMSTGDEVEIKYSISK